MNEDFGEYQHWNWSIFVKHAKLTLDDVVTLEEEELEELEEPMFFWSRLSDEEMKKLEKAGFMLDDKNGKE